MSKSINHTRFYRFAASRFIAREITTDKFYNCMLYSDILFKIFIILLFKL